jgi:hypothetical protein
VFTLFYKKFRLKWTDTSDLLWRSKTIQNSFCNKHVQCVPWISFVEHQCLSLLVNLIDMWCWNLTNLIWLCVFSMQEFEVPTDPLGDSELSSIRDSPPVYCPKSWARRESFIVPMHLLWSNQAASALCLLVNLSIIETVMWLVHLPMWDLLMNLHQVPMWINLCEIVM